MEQKYAIGLGFSSACNMNCPFCYSRGKREQACDIDLNSWYRFFQRNFPYIESINYGTGENTTSEDWYKLISFIRNNYPGIRQALTTNGYLYAAQANDEFKRNILIECLDEVDVSLDFGVSEIHNKCRGNPRAFEWAIGSLEFCKRNNLIPTIVTLGIDETLSITNMSKIFSIAESYGAKVRINLYRPVEKGSPIIPASLNSILTFFDWVSKTHKILSVSDPLFSSLLCAGRTNSDPSGKSSMRITQDGNIYPSTYLLYNEFLMGNILTFDMGIDLKNNPGSRKLVEAPIPKDCIECKYSSQCKGGVLDRRYIWFGSFDKKDPYCFVESKEKMRNYMQMRDGFTSVHDGYLPTLFFQP